MSENNHVLIALTQNHARVWRSGLASHTVPERVEAPAEKGSHNHLRQTQHQGRHAGDPPEHGFFDEIGRKVSNAEEILLIGHGEAKANATLRFINYMSDHYPDIAKKVRGTIDANLNAMTDNEILARARDWFDTYHRTGLS